MLRTYFIRQEEPVIIRFVSETNPRRENGTDVTMGGQFSGTNPDISPATGSQQSPSPDPDNHNIQYLYAIIPKQLMTGHFKKKIKYTTQNPNYMPGHMMITVSLIVNVLEMTFCVRI